MAAPIESVTYDEGAPVAVSLGGVPIIHFNPLRTHEANVRPMAHLLVHHAHHMIEDPAIKQIRLTAYRAGITIMWTMHVTYKSYDPVIEPGQLTPPLLLHRIAAHDAIGRRVQHQTGGIYRVGGWSQDHLDGFIHWMEPIPDGDG